MSDDPESDIRSEEDMWTLYCKRGLHATSRIFIRAIELKLDRKLLLDEKDLVVQRLKGCWEPGFEYAIKLRKELVHKFRNHHRDPKDIHDWLKSFSI